MGIIELLLIAIGLSADAFAVAVTNGMCMKNIKLGWTFAIAITFGLFQGANPVIGYALGIRSTDFITKYDHIIALVLLCFIGAKMIIDSIDKDKGDKPNNILKMSFGVLMVQGLATSIDALAIGVSFAAMHVNIILSASIICLTTLIISFVGVLIGKRFGNLLNQKAQIFGGIILVCLGLKIFIEGKFFS